MANPECARGEGVNHNLAEKRGVSFTLFLKMHENAIFSLIRGGGAYAGYALCWIRHCVRPCMVKLLVPIWLHEGYAYNALSPHPLTYNTNYGNLFSLHTVGLRIKTHEGFLNSDRLLLKRFYNVGCPGDMEAMVLV